MSWSVSGEIKREDAPVQIEALNPSYELGEGAQKQLAAAKVAAIELIDVVAGETFNVSLGGHCKADSPDSANDAINISIYAQK